MQLELLFGKCSSFRTIQESVVRAIYSGQSPILSVLPTGGGKSLLFLLPASYDFSGVTIVLLPLISLREDLYRRTKELGILSIIWHPSLTSIEYNIVFTTPESLRNTQFWTFLLKLRTIGRLDRIVVDECHLSIQNTISYRPIIGEIGRLTQLGVRLLFLTATMPPEDEPRFWRTMGFIDNIPTYTYRTSTLQSNAKYSVEYLTYDNRYKILQSHILKHTGKTIVFASQTRTVKDLGSTLECYSYYADLGDKDEQLAKFRTTENSIIITTTALSLGVHIPDVRHIIHYDLPDTLLDYVQESGRGGRDSKAYTSTIYFITGRRTKDPPLAQYLSTKEENQCRRTTIASYLDGTDVQCLLANSQASPDIEQCDRCQSRRTEEEYTINYQKQRRTTDYSQDSQISPTSLRTTNKRSNPEPLSIVEESTKRLQDNDAVWQQQERLREQERRTSTIAQMEQAETQTQTLWLLSKFSLACPSCFFILRTADHNENQCTRRESKEFRERSLNLRRKVQLAPYSGCFQCWLPQKVCSRWCDVEGSRTMDKGKTCQYPNLVRDCCIWLLDSTEAEDGTVQAVIESQYGTGYKLGMADIVRLGSQKTRLYDWETTKLFQLICFILIRTMT